MFNKKILISLTVFSVLMFLTSIIKTQTRLIEKNISFYEKKVSNLENNLHETQLDYFYLSSPDYISKKILEYSNEEYSSIKYSEIYFSLEQFIDQQKKTTKFLKHEEKK